MIMDGTRKDVVDVPVHSLKYIKEKFEEIRMDDKGTVKKRDPSKQFNESGCYV